MKRIAILMLAVLTVFMTSCLGNDEAVSLDSIVSQVTGKESNKQNEQSVEEGNTDNEENTSDADVSEEAASDSDEAEVIEAEEPQVEEAPDYTSSAVGTWGGEGAILVVTSTDMTYQFSYSNEMGTRVAEIYQSYPIAVVEDNKARVSFEDSWGNKGILFITFSQDAVTVEQKVTESGGGLWGVVDDVMTLVRVEETKAENLLDSMDSEERRGVNIFLSNFSEANFASYGNGSLNQNEQLLDFAFKHNKINVPGRIRQDMAQNGKWFDIIDVVNVDSTLIRYFGHTIPHQSYLNYDLNGDRYYTPATSGVPVAYFTSASSMIDNGDGTYNVEFSVFFDDNNSSSTSLSHWYYYTWEEANANCQLIYNGYAVLSEKLYDGAWAYEVENYTVY